MRLPLSLAHFVRLTEDGYPPTVRHLEDCRWHQQGEWLGEREATETEMLVLPVCQGCRQVMQKVVSQLGPGTPDQQALQVALKAAGWVSPPPIDERKLRYGSFTEVGGGLPSLGKDQ